MPKRLPAGAVLVALPPACCGIEAVADTEMRVQVAPTRARRPRASCAACARRRRPSGRRGPSRIPRRARRRARAAPPARRAGQQVQQLELAARQADRAPADERLEHVGPDLELAGDDRLDRLRGQLACARGGVTAASMRASTSSGWHGLVTQSSAPSRSPRTRWATLVGPVQTITAGAPDCEQSLLEVGPAVAARAAPDRSRPRAPASPAAPRPAAGSRAAASRQPTAPTRFASTRTKPLSESTTARRTAAGAAREGHGPGAARPLPARRPRPGV